MTREEIEAFFDRRQHAWQRRDPVALAADHAAECVVDSPASGEIVGRGAIEAVYRSWLAAFPDLDFQSEDLVVDGGKVAQCWTAAGTHSGPFCGLSATGKRFKIRGVFLYEMKDQKIAHERRIYDFTALLLQIGVLKAKPE